MKSLRPALWLTPLALTGAAVVMWPTDGTDEDPGLARSQPGRERGVPATRGAFSISNPPTGPRQGAGSEAMLVTGSTRRVEQRLGKLNQLLGLTSDQKREVRSLLVRSSDGYEPGALMPGGAGLPPRITRVRMQELIHDLLDPMQQADYEDLLLDDQLWWAEVIDRLERDIEQSTDPVEELSNEPADPEPPSAPAQHRGGNVLDLLNPPEP